MTKEQFEQWCDFALRMAHAGNFGSRRPTHAWIAAQVQEFFVDLDEDMCTYVGSWLGKPDWFRPVQNWLDDLRLDTRPCFEERIFEHEESRTFWWTDTIDSHRVAERNGAAKRRWDRQWFGPVASCIRSGLVAATGVAAPLGVSLVTLLKMYPEGIPDFVWRPEIQPQPNLRPAGT